MKKLRNYEKRKRVLHVMLILENTPFFNFMWNVCKM